MRLWCNPAAGGYPGKYLAESCAGALEGHERPNRSLGSLLPRSRDFAKRYRPEFCISDLVCGRTVSNSVARCWNEAPVKGTTFTSAVAMGCALLAGTVLKFQLR